MEAKWDYYSQMFYIEEPIEDQTLCMAFYREEVSLDTVYYNVCASIYSKRKQARRNEESAKITGKNPLMSFLKGRKAFRVLEQACIERDGERRDVMIYVRWVDNRRRDAYYKVLSKMGYRYGKDQDNMKCLYRKIKRSKKNDI